MSEIVRSLEDSPSIADVCGMIKVLSSEGDFKEASLAHAVMRAPTIPHYHPIATEFYFILEGNGKLVVGKNTHEIKAGMLVIIPPNNAHYTIPRGEMKVLAFSAPAWSQEDQIVLQVSDTVAGYSSPKERFELIEEVIWTMSPHEEEAFTAERRARILQVDWNNMSIPELRELLGTS